MSEKTFINPYNFVPLPHTAVERSEKITKHERFRGYSGSLTVKLKTLTRLFIPDRRKDSTRREDVEIKPGVIKQHPHYDKFLENEHGDKIIPGSSLKGMLRSVAETLSNSCFALDTGEFGKHHHGHCTLLPDETGLCICCRIFGYVPAEAKSAQAKDGETAKALRGRVTFYDAILQPPPEGKTYLEQKAEGYRLKELLTPRPHHEAFYLDHNSIRGRKFYYHYPAEPKDFITEKKTHLNCTIHECISPEAEFKFQIHFENLSAKELGLLLYAICLDGKEKSEASSMAHKIGMAKPLGFGSVRLSVEEFNLIENDAAYLDFTQPEKTDKTLKELLEGYQPDPFLDCGDIYNVWKFPRTTTLGKVKYPGQQWFNRYKTHLLPANGELPELDGNNSAEKPDLPRRKRSKRSQKTTGSTYKLGDKKEPEASSSESSQPPKPAAAELVVKVLKVENPYVFVEIEGARRKIKCSHWQVRKGSQIAVQRNEDGTYEFKEVR